MKREIILLMLACSLILSTMTVSGSPPDEPTKDENDGRIRICGAQGGEVEINITITLKGDDNSTKEIRISMPLQAPADYSTAASWLCTILNNSYGDYFDAEVVPGRYGVEGLWYGIVDFNVKGQPNGPQYTVKSIKITVDGKVNNKGSGAALPKSGGPKIEPMIVTDEGMDTGSFFLATNPLLPLGYAFLDITGDPSIGYTEIWVDENWAVVHSSGKTILQIKNELKEKLMNKGIPVEITNTEEMFIAQMNADSGVWIGTTDRSIDVSLQLYLNTAPYKPLTPTGPSQGKPNNEYEFTAQATDPDNDRIQYGWDWNGDGTVDEWTEYVESGEQYVTRHTWIEKGSYDIFVKAKDEHGYEGDWSDPLTISMPKLQCYYTSERRIHTALDRFTFLYSPFFSLFYHLT
ncbi:MAG: hypothetical protein QCH96_03845 [Candidatus Thermoplasmatota archaeon]|nr:hypothetical protein [Candidatus Thermoplasmatota archaeon]